MKLPKFRRLHVTFTGPFILFGLLSIVVVSVIAIRSARGVMGNMAGDLARESSDLSELAVGSWGKLPSIAETMIEESLRFSQKLPIEKWRALLSVMHATAPQLKEFSLIYPDLKQGLRFSSQSEGSYKLIYSSAQEPSTIYVEFEPKINQDQTLKDAPWASEVWLEQLHSGSADSMHTVELVDQAKSSERILTLSEVRVDPVTNKRFFIQWKLSLSHLEGLLRLLFKDKSSRSFIVDGEGRVLVTSWSQELVTSKKTQAIFPTGFDHSDCFIRCTLREALNLFGSLSISQRELILAPGISTNLHAGLKPVSRWGSFQAISVAVVAEQSFGFFVKDVSKDVFWLALSILMLLLLVGYYLSWKVTTPILSLNQSLKSFDGGNWNEKSLVSRKDEIGELSRSFAQMAQRLRDLVRNLEARVEERTSELKVLLEKYAFANQELESSNQLKDRFFSIIAHDLKNPVGALRGYAGILVDSIDALPAEQVKTMVERMALSAQEAQGLLENLLQWALVQNQGLQVNWESVSVSEILAEVFELMRINAQSKNIKLVSELEEELWIEADRNMAATVVRNLVSNAIKYSPIETGEVRVLARSQEDYVWIQVYDNGIGMKEDFIAGLFRNESHQSQKGTNNERGTGLGLGLCFEFVAMNKGQIEVESKLGQGSVFTTMWRRSQAGERSDWTELNGEPVFLCVDDSQDNHNLIAISMRKLSWEKKFITNAEEALQWLEENRADVILMDLQLEGMNGIEATRKIRELERKHKRHPSYIVAFTASVLQKDIDAAMAAGCDSYLIKPISRQNLVHILGRYEARLRLRIRADLERGDV